LYHNLYRVREALLNVQRIEDRFGFLRGTTAHAQRNLLARQLDLQEELRRNERAIKATAVNQATRVAGIAFTTINSNITTPNVGRSNLRPNTEPSTSMETDP
jgi:hypothetical protein